MRLTIVLTIYNKEQYIRRAIDSLLNQENTDGDDYEVLAINDGSTDGSEVIAKEYALKDKRIRIINQPNQGLSIARNNGVDFANGDYIWFVDADDTIASNAVSLICKAIEDCPDIIPIYAITEGTDIVRNKVSVNPKNGREILIDGKWEHCGVFNVLRKEFLRDNNLRFYPGIYHEDSEFTPRMLYAAKSVKVIPQILYYVYRDPNSITQVPKAKRAYDYLLVAERIHDFIYNNNEEKTQVGKAVFNSMSVCINYAMLIICQNDKNEQKKFNQEFYNKKAKLLDILLSSSVIKFRIESILFGLFPKQYVGLYQLMKRL